MQRSFHIMHSGIIACVWQLNRSEEKAPARASRCDPARPVRPLSDPVPATAPTGDLLVSQQLKIARVAALLSATAVPRSADIHRTWLKLRRVKQYLDVDKPRTMQ